MAIPKVIHYCWFGGGEKDKLVIKCIESWKKNVLIMRLLNGMKVIMITKKTSICMKLIKKKNGDSFLIMLD